MHEPSRATAPQAPMAAPAEALWRPPFLATQPAVAASAREFAHLLEEVAAGVAGLELDDSAHASQIRRAPYRNIVQLGPVAVTLTWLRDREESAAAGRLLVMVWHGVIAAVGAFQFERPIKIASTATAHVVWEGEYTPEAESEETWRWRPLTADAESIASAELAEQCVAELARAYASARLTRTEVLIP